MYLRDCSGLRNKKKTGKAEKQAKQRSRTAKKQKNRNCKSRKAAKQRSKEIEIQEKKQNGKTHNSQNQSILPFRSPPLCCDSRALIWWNKNAGVARFRLPELDRCEAEFRWTFRHRSGSSWWKVGRKLAPNWRRLAYFVWKTVPPELWTWWPTLLETCLASCHVQHIDPLQAWGLRPHDAVLDQWLVIDQWLIHDPFFIRTFPSCIAGSKDVPGACLRGWGATAAFWVTLDHGNRKAGNLKRKKTCRTYILETRFYLSLDICRYVDMFWYREREVKKGAGRKRWECRQGPTTKFHSLNCKMIHDHIKH